MAPPTFHIPPSTFEVPSDPMPSTIDQIIAEELTHLGPASLGHDQATLRAEYVSFRREALAWDRDSRPGPTLRRALSSVRSYARDFEPLFDADFFAD